MEFVFDDESMYTLNDGYLQMGFEGTYEDIPGYYHGGAGCFSFADGHAELHRWLGNVLPNPAKNPYQYGKSTADQGLGSGPSTNPETDPDYQWLTNHASCRGYGE
jgi:prepilin-type processing-associated H-X9-DG protein